MEAKQTQAKPYGRPLVPGKHVVIITQVNPHTPVGGVTVVMRNLLSVFDKSSYTIAYIGRFSLGRQVADHEECYRLIPNYHPVQIAGLAFKTLKHRFAARRAIKLAKSKGSDIVVGLYPTFASLKIATDVAEALGAEYFPYLHDTVAEGLSHTDMATDAAALQQRVFRVATKVMTMSEGMTRYFQEQYGLDSHPLVHSYPEPVRDQPASGRQDSAFWGGEVYAINNRSFTRVQKALENLNIPLEVTSLSSLSIDEGSNIQRNFYPTREEYIQAVSHHGILILAINWPDESDVHEAELSTIFPTKTIEYLATGSPILIHCPEHYFLARFFRERNCGVVVTSKDEASLAEGIQFLLAKSEATVEMQRNALETAHMFSIDKVSQVFERLLEPRQREPS